MLLGSVLVLTSLSFMGTCLPAAQAPSAKTVPGDATISRKAGPSEIRITTTSRIAGAIHSLTWNGKEFVDSTDHGRQIQSASNFDVDGKFIPEVFNPTEAGSLADGAGPKSTSQLLELSTRDHQLHSRSRMAFWLKPGEKSQGNPARNAGLLSEHFLSKDVAIGYKDMPHAIEYRVVFSLPRNEKHTFGQYEAVTGYMPAEFSRFLRFDRKQQRLLPLSDGPGEQSDPIVLSTEDGRYAMGVYSPDQPSAGFESAGYGRFRFKTEKVVKWNCVFREKNSRGIAMGDRSFRCFLIVGAQSDCESTLAALAREFRK